MVAASSISAALLLTHSVVDYPLGAPALMGLLGVTLGFAAAAFAIRRVSHPSASAQRERVVSPGVARKPFTPFKPAAPQAETTPPEDRP